MGILSDGNLEAPAMMTTRRIWFLILASLIGPAETVRAGGRDDVTGRVLNADGQPVVGARISNHWRFEVGNPKISTHEAVVTDAEGRFTLEMKFRFGRSGAILALASDERTGGIVQITPAQAATRAPVAIKLGPMVRVHGKIESAGTNHPLKMATVMVMLADNSALVATGSSFQHHDLKPAQKPKWTPPTFDIRLPAGDYVLHGLEPTQPSSHKGVAHKLQVKADQPNLDLEFATMKLPLTALASQPDQAPPALQVKAMRGVAADVKLADFRGKWVLLEFWTTTCGPCIAEGLPEMMRLVDDYTEMRDKFVVLAIHGPGADDLADLDRKLVPIVRDIWNGRELPFPILLDDEGKTFTAYGVQSIPETIVINPEGKIAAGGVGEMLETFPTPPISLQVARALDRPIQAMISGADGGTKLSAVLETLGTGHEFAIKPDLAAWQGASVTADTRVPLSLIGPVSLRTALKLVLEPLGLAAIPGPDGLIVTTPPASPPPVGSSAAWITFQVRSAERLQRRLDGPTTLHCGTKPLADLLDQISQEVDEAIVLDPIQRRAGAIDPNVPATLEVDEVPLGQALKAMLGPLGLEAVVRDEVILIQKRR